MPQVPLACLWEVKQKHLIVVLEATKRMLGWMAWHGCWENRWIEMKIGTSSKISKCWVSKCLKLQTMPRQTLCLIFFFRQCMTFFSSSTFNAQANIVRISLTFGLAVATLAATLGGICLLIRFHLFVCFTSIIFLVVLSLIEQLNPVQILFHHYQTCLRKIFIKKILIIINIWSFITD